MNAETIFDFILERWVGRADFLGNCALLGTGVLLVGCLISWTLRDRSAAVRCCVWQYTMAGLLLLPIVSLIIPGIPLRLTPGTLTSGSILTADVPLTGDISEPIDVQESQEPRSSTEVVRDDARATETETVEEATRATLRDPNRQAATRPDSMISMLASRITVTSATTWASLLWIVGLAFHTLRLVYSTHRARTTMVDAVAFPEDLRQPLVRLVNLPRSLPVLTSRRVQIPITLGIWRPRIILPCGSESWPAGQLRMVVAHELAHIRRKDVAWQLLAFVAASIHWFNPLSWLAARRMRELREFACDDRVVTRHAAAADYAMNLVNVAASLSGRPLAAPMIASMAVCSKLEHRVETVLDQSVPRNPASIGVRRNLAAVIALIVLGLAVLRPFGKPALVAQAPDASQEQAESHEQLRQEGVVRFAGQVIGPDGQPVAGARVRYAEAHTKSARDDARLRFVAIWPVVTVYGEETISDTNGRFTLDHHWKRWNEIHDNAQEVSMSYQQLIIATAQGSQVGWRRDIQFFRDRNGSIQLNVPTRRRIEGRLVDAEGQPIPDAMVSVEWVTQPEDDRFEQWLAKVHSPTDSARNVRPKGDPFGHESPREKALRFPVFEPATGSMLGLQPVRTDQDGQFEISGIGEDQLALLKVTANGFAETLVNVVMHDRGAIAARAPNNLGPYHYSNLSDTYHAANFTLVVPRSQPLLGNIRDSETKEAIPGVWVATPDRRFSAQTDEQGNFYLNGAAAGTITELRIEPKPSTPYFPQQVSIERFPAGMRAHRDVELTAGVWISGRVTNVATDTGQSNMTVHYTPLLKNTYADNYASFDPRSRRVIINSRRYRTDEQGRFRVLGIRGRGVVMTRCREGEFQRGVGREEIDRLEQENDGSRLTYDDISAHLANGFALVDVPLDGLNGLVMKVDPGKQMTLNVVDPTGKAVDEFMVAGNTNGITAPRFSIQGSSVKLEGMIPGKPRPVLVRNDQRRIGAVRTIDSGSGGGTRTIQLQPLATIKGRLINREGNPVPDAEVRIDLNHSFLIGLASVFTDEGGRFEFDQLLPGGGYRVFSSQAGPVRHAELHESLHPEPGETIDLGVIDISSDHRPKPKRTSSETGKNDTPDPTSGSPEL